MLRLALFGPVALAIFEVKKDHLVTLKNNVDAVGGMRSEAERTSPTDRSSGPANDESITFKIHPMEREDCVGDAIKKENAIGNRGVNLYVDATTGAVGINGDKCSDICQRADRNPSNAAEAACKNEYDTAALAESACHNAYESKSRHSHTTYGEGPNQKSHPGHSLKGEVQLCKWKPALAGHNCEPQSPITVCGTFDPFNEEVDVIQVTNGGVGAGNAAVTGTLPAEPAGLPSVLQPYVDNQVVETSLAEKKRTSST